MLLSPNLDAHYECLQQLHMPLEFFACHVLHVNLCRLIMVRCHWLPPCQSAALRAERRAHLNAGVILPCRQKCRLAISARVQVRLRYAQILAISHADSTVFAKLSLPRLLLSE